MPDHYFASFTPVPMSLLTPNSKPPRRWGTSSPVRYRPFRYPLPLGSAFGSGKSNIQKWQLMKNKSPRNQTISRTFGTPRGIRTPGLLVRRLSQGQIGVISAPICAVCRRSLGGFSIFFRPALPAFFGFWVKSGSEAVGRKAALPITPKKFASNPQK